jgi:D-glycero-beta-D-manno-heptose 1-phosphate adenylyltransferase
MNPVLHIKDKILRWPEARKIVQQWQKQGMKVVFSNGCFDLVHRGHVEYLANARAKGDRLVLGLNTDASVRRIKGDLRPVVDEQSRSFLMAAFEFVDIVILFDEDTPYELIKSLQPDVLVKGDDYKATEIVGHDVVKNRGGEVITIPLVEGFSTTKLIEKIKNAF